MGVLFQILGIVMLLVTAFLIVVKPRQGMMMASFMSFSNFGLEAYFNYQLIYKILLLGALISFILRVGLQRGWKKMLAILGIFFVYAFCISIPSLSNKYGLVDMVTSYLTFFVGCLLMFVSWKHEKDILWMLKAVALMAPLNLLISFLSTGMLYADGFLVTSSSKAWVAYYAAISVMAVYMMRQMTGKYHIWLLLINAIVILVAKQRTPFVIFAALSLPYLRDVTRHLRRRVVVAIMVCLPIVMIVGGLTLMDMIERTFDTSGSFGANNFINSSNRLYVWETLWTHSEGHHVFGLGLGFIKTMEGLFINLGFIAPHNEYLRFIFETGYIGLAIVMYAFASAYRRVYKRSPFRFMLWCFYLCYVFFAFFDNPISSMQMFVPTSILLSIYSTCKGSNVQKKMAGSARIHGKAV